MFLIGIRDDKDNNFRWPVEEHLTKRLKDVLEENVDEKYFLSVQAIERICNSKFNQDFKDENTDASGCLTAGYYKIPSDGNYLKIKSATSKGYEEATEGDSINFSVPNSETRRGRVGKGVAQTLDTACNQGVMVVAFGRTEEEKKRRKEHFKKTGKDSGSFKDTHIIVKSQDHYHTILANPNPVKEGLIMVGDYRADEGFRWREDGNSPTICARAREDGSGQPVIQFGNQGVIQLNPSKESGGQQPYQQNRVYDINGINPALNSGQEIWGGNIINTYKIRRLTPRECFRLMDFPDTFTWPVSDSQAYKQAGNSIVVNVLYKIIKNLNL